MSFSGVLGVNIIILHFYPQTINIKWSHVRQFGHVLNKVSIFKSLIFVMQEFCAILQVQLLLFLAAHFFKDENALSAKKLKITDKLTGPT